ncbi:unnamed protein product [Chironomus riparius]|uniref:MADF domain-containing protein n=1 Tax=Chironomus riparius TaxID=315576 RepID=A0A9N9WQQ2_9DIPT|nr:unnamed protein product [Chironomus riparius]
MIKFKLKQEGPFIDDEKLIEEVSKHSFLYDTRSTDYRNLPLRSTIWSSIAKILNVEDQNLVQKRWKVIREKFSLAYRKQILEEINSHWNLYDSLTFLEPFVNLKHESKKYKSEESFGSDKSCIVTKSPLDEQVLIQLVKERPVLFDKKHEDFRVGSARKKAWDEVSAIVNWDIDTLQKRWRVMRDRFVRELRRSKNADTETQLNCSSFFREMLFLTHHVRSKKYEVEAHFDDSEDSRGYEYEQCDTKPFIAQKEQKFEDNTNIEIVTEQSFAHYIDDNDDLESSLRYEETVLEEHVDVHDDEFIEEIVECSQNDQDEHELMGQEVDNVVAMEEISKNHWIKRDSLLTDNKVMIKKRRMSEDIQNQPLVKSVRLTESQSSMRNPMDVTDNDEDLTFGNTLGCMLKRIPQHLKTAVKLKLLQSLAEFEAEHKI